MAKAASHSSENSTSDDRPMCGIIRPIAALGDYPASHWRDVHEILADAAATAGYNPRLVSESDASGVILSEIITNIYNDPVIICDVSGKNPNVMFELGLRMAFEKPIIIVADDTTDFSFDISPVKHLKYPRSLRFKDIIEFKDSLTVAIRATVKSASSPGHRGYLQQFGPIHVTELKSQSVDIDSIAQELVEIKRVVQSLASGPPARRRAPVGESERKKYVFRLNISDDQAKKMENEIDAIEPYVSYVEKGSDGYYKFEIEEFGRQARTRPEFLERLQALVDPYDVRLT